MSALPAVPCLGQCGRTVRRSRSLPLCRACDARAYAIFLERSRGVSMVDQTRVWNRFWGSAETVAAALAAGV